VGFAVGLKKIAARADEVRVASLSPTRSRATVGGTRAVGVSPTAFFCVFFLAGA
jgi:hypothetical protein